MKKVISIIMAMAMVLGMGAMAFATDISAPGDATSLLKLTGEAATFSVTVPTNLPITLAADGTITVSNTASIVNNSNGAVEVTAVTVTGQNSWTQHAWDGTNALNDQSVGAKIFALKVQAADTNADTASSAAAIGSIAANDSVALTYDAQIAPQKTAIAETSIANVVFTIGWDD